ncbi:hypothetical protein [Pilimelia terevasa]|uniref:hypothetical protein n=1 Tax=Pilimelia terevasa TaxID=53372 RepID=UPI001662A179|nr:hypothetical protein [Pilimelia terevasa]
MLIVDDGLADPPEEPFDDARRLAFLADDVVCLYVLSGGWREAAVTFGAVPGRPEDGGLWDEMAEGTIRLSTGRLAVSIAFEQTGSPPCVVGPPGRYGVKVSARGRDLARKLPQVRELEMADIPVGVEQFLVEFWPLAD